MRPDGKKPDDTMTDRRRQTRNKIYSHIFKTKNFCSRQSIASDLGLSLPTVYQNLSELMSAGLVSESGEYQYTGGRKAIGLSIVADARVAVGISVTEHHLRLAATDLKLNELAYQKVSLEPFERFSDLGRLLARILEEFLDSFSIDRERLLGVGIALPAVMSPDSHRITAAPTLQLKDMSLEGLTDFIPYPTYVENDATSGGYAEFFARFGDKNMAYISLENGVGGAILIGKTPYLGDNLRSAEFGHICVEPGGLQCACGKNGCLEAYCSLRRIQETFNVTTEEFFSRLAQGGAESAEYASLWDNMLHHLAIGICNIRLALDCDVILGGMMSEYLEPYLPRLKKYVSVISPLETNTDYLNLSIFRHHTVSLGVALHFISDFMNNI
ncbi:MAG: ROK family transcriptional regulator [Eubacterium sp.]|nr:ROK family transcriptional regulator [Eubacterium sp.]